MKDESPAPAHPGVRFPPPLLFVGGFLAGWSLRRRYPLQLLPDALEGIGEPLGIALIVAGLVVIAWGIATFRAHRTAVLPHHPAARIVRRGPYRFTRNPMYTGMTAAYCGGALLLDDVWPLILLPFVLFLLVRLVIAREERYLSSAFPGEYGEYRRQVRRWL